MGADIKGQTMAALTGRIDAMDEQASKACTRCGAVKLMTEFGTEKRTRDGRTAQCKACIYKKNKAWSQANNTGRHYKSQRAWAKKNPDKCRKYIDAWRARNKDYALEAGRARAAIRVALISPSYCATIIGIPTAELTPELLALKREQLTIRRLARQLKEKANESSTDPR